MELDFSDQIKSNSSLWENIRKKKERIKRGSKEKMRKVGDKGAPTKEQIERAKGEKRAVDDAKDFKPHMMYDPETGKAFKANKPADHERMSKMGYTHTKPKKKAGMGMKKYLYGGMVPKLGPAKKFISDSAPFSTAVDKYYRSNR